MGVVKHHLCVLKLVTLGVEELEKIVLEGGGREVANVKRAAVVVFNLWFLS